MISGIVQGSVIAGLCFLIFINDLPDSITDSFSGLFCDDTLVAKEILSTTDSETLQTDLNKVFEWTQKWGMSFNTVKCTVMTVSNNKKTLQYNYHLDNSILSRKESIKYLGVTIDNKLTFKQHTELKCNSASKLLNLLRRNLYYAPKSVKSKAFTSCVRPILEYANICWAPTSEKHNNMLEKVQHKAAKFATNIYPKKGHYDSFSMTRLLKELNWNTLEQRRTQARLCMVYKIKNNMVILDPSYVPKTADNRLPRLCREPKVGRANKLFEKQARLNVTSHTFFYSAPRQWNHLVTAQQANAPNIEAFKQCFDK